MSRRERVALANSLLGTSVETREQAVAALLASDDPWLRSCGVYAVGMLRLTSLSPELDRLDAQRRSAAARNRPRRAPSLAGIDPDALAPPPGEEHEHAWRPAQEGMGVG